MFVFWVAVVVRFASWCVGVTVVAVHPFVVHAFVAVVVC